MGVINNVSRDDILMINKWCQSLVVDIENTEGIRENNLLSSIPEAINQTFGGEELYQNLHIKAAYFWGKISKYHCFVDGNKRTALVTMIAFLKLNNVDFNTGEKSLYDTCINIACGLIDIEGISKYIEQNSTNKEIPSASNVESILRELEKDTVLCEIIVKLGKEI